MTALGREAAAPLFDVGHRPIVRIAGMGVRVLGELRCRATLADVEELIDRNARLAAEALKLSEVLYECVARMPEAGGKSALLDLRRAVYKGVSGRISRCLRRAESLLASDVVRQIGCLRTRLEERETYVGRLNDTLSIEVLEKVAVLRTAAADPRFRHGLVQSGSGVADAVEKWISEPSNAVPARRVLLRVALYLSRVTMKTSPYSTFTVVGLGEWRDGGPAIRFHREMEASGVLTLDVRVPRAIERALAGTREVREGFGVRVNPSASIVDDRICLLGPTVTEPIVSVALTPEAVACMELVRANEWITVRDLHTHLPTQVKTLKSAASSQRYVDRLIDVGLLEARIPIADQCEEPLGELAEYLERRIRTGWWSRPNTIGYCRRVARLCRDLQAAIRAPTDPGTVSQHRFRLATVKGRVEELRRAVAPPSGDPSVEAGELVHEDMLLPRPVVECARELWAPALHDLDIVRRWFAIHDPQLPLRVSLAEYCRERFGAGACVPFMAFYHAVQRDLRAADSAGAGSANMGALRAQLRGQPAGGTADVPRLEEVERLRVQAVDQVVEARASEDGVIRIAPSVLERFSEEWPPYVRASSSVACYVQPVVYREYTHLVLNAMLSGYGRGAGRWLRLMRRVGCACETMPSAETDGGSGERRRLLLAESRGVFGTGLNLRSPIAGYEIEYPGVVSDRSASKRLALRDVAVRHDVNRNLVRLYSDRLNADLQPVHGGMMVEALLPPALAFMLRGFGSPTLHYPTIPFLAADRRSWAKERILTLPRINVGRVTLRRACWLVERHAIPRRRKRQSDGMFFFEVHQWLREEGIPVQCFVRVRRSRTGASSARFFRKHRKPVFVDFANWFLVGVFSRMVGMETGNRNDVFVFEEAYPAPGQAVASEGSQCEFIVEITGR